MCPPFSQMGSVWFAKKKKEKNSCELLKYPKARFQKRGVERKKTIRVSSCASSHVSKRRYQPWLHGMRGVRGRLNWTRFSTMVWSPSCYPNTNKQRRNIGVNDRGGGWRRVRGRAERPRAPEPQSLKSERPVRITNTSRPSSGRDSHAAAALASKLLCLFPRLFTTCYISANVRDIRVVCMATWKVSRTWNFGKLLATLYWSSSPL